MKSDIKPSDDDLERAARGRSPEELAELAARAKADPSLARAIAELEGEPPPGAVTPLQGTPVAPNDDEAAQVRRTVPRAGGHRLQQSAIPTRPRFEDLSGLHEYAGDPEGAGLPQELAPVPPSPMPGPVEAALPIEALREASEAKREVAGIRRGVWIVAALIPVLGLLAYLWFANATESGAPNGSGIAPPAVSAAVDTPTKSSLSVAPTAPSATATSTASPETSAAPSAVAPEASGSVSSAAPTAATATASAQVAKPPTTAKPSGQPGPTGAIPTGWSNEVVP